jgi:hypothetical protein
VQSFGPRFAVVFILAAIPWGAVRADIFRCQAADGKTLYSDAACPHGAVRSANITNAVGACSTTECMAQREQAAGYARERLRSEQELLANLTEKRLRAELDAATERARLDELIWRQSFATRVSGADETGYAVGYPGYYPFYSLYPARPCGARCAGLHPRPHHGIGAAKRTWGVAARVPATAAPMSHQARPPSGHERR